MNRAYVDMERRETMYKLDDRMRLAATRLLEMSDRVLGKEASLSDRYTYINVMLSQWSDRLDIRLRTHLRLSCYEALFKDAPEDDPPEA